jgi:hypothetical protein
MLVRRRSNFVPDSERAAVRFALAHFDRMVAAGISVGHARARALKGLSDDALTSYVIATFLSETTERSEPSAVVRMLARLGFLRAQRTSA